jgi:hypothetical protein
LFNEKKKYLEVLYLSYNSVEGEVKEGLFPPNLINLKELRLQRSQFTCNRPAYATIVINFDGL